MKKLDPKCGMCFDSLRKKYPNAILSPCCRNSWFHLKCIKKFALTSASLFKCPLCGYKKTDKWAKLGIFFPIRDAAWELDENAYQELYEPIKLSCEDSKCKDKSLHAGEMHMWRLCQLCGAEGVHEYCFQGSVNDKYTCKGCQDVINQPKSDTSSEPDSDADIKPIKRTENDQTQHESENNNIKEYIEKPNSLAATLYGQSDVSSDDDIWKQSPLRVINMRSVILDNSDFSDDENQPPLKKAKTEVKELLKQKSLASIMLGESDATSDDSDADCKLIIL